jgi:hypothetical protein
METADANVGQKRSLDDSKLNTIATLEALADARPDPKKRRAKVFDAFSAFRIISSKLGLFSISQFQLQR